MARTIFGDIAPLLNPFSFVKGVGRAARDVFSDPPYVPPARSPYRIDRRMIKPPANDMFEQWETAKNSGADVEDFEYYARYGAPIPPPVEARAPQLTQPPEELHAQALSMFVPMKAEQKMFEAPSMTDMPYASDAFRNQLPGAILDRNAWDKETVGAGFLEPAAPPSHEPPIRQAPRGNVRYEDYERVDPRDYDDVRQVDDSYLKAMRSMLMNQFANSAGGADQQLAYALNDLNRRSGRDISDDFFGSVVAPLAGGLSRKPGNIHQLGANYLEQARGRRGERINLINALAGRQNRAQEFLLKTDPSSIKNQSDLIRALAARDRAAAYGQNIEYRNDYQQGKLGIDRQKVGVSQQNADSLKRYREAQIEVARGKLEELVKAGVLKRDVAEAQMQKWLDDTAYKNRALEVKEDIAAMSERGKNSRFTEGQEGQMERLQVREVGQDRRLGVREEGQDKRLKIRESGQDRRLGVREEGLTQRAAGRLNASEPVMSDEYRSLAKVPPQMRKNFSVALARYRSMPRKSRERERAGFTQAFHVDPGE